MKNILTMLLLSGLVFGCAAQAPTPQTLARENGWAVVRANGEAVDAAAGAWFAFDLEQQAISGNTGCNLLRGAFNVDGQALSVPPLAVTKRACQAPRMQTEQRVLAALSDASEWRLGANNRLQLLGKDGAVVLEAEPRQISAI